MRRTIRDGEERISRASRATYHPLWLQIFPACQHNQLASMAMADPSALDALAGTWSQQEADTLQAAIAPLEQVDADLWG